MSDTSPIIGKKRNAKKPKPLIEARNGGKIGDKFVANGYKGF